MVSREIIIEFSTKLFMSRGVKSVTMDEIAGECGISKRTLYEQFRDKSELLEACINTMNCRVGEKIAQITKESDNVIQVLIKIHEFQAHTVQDMYDNFYKEVMKFFPEVFQNTIRIMREHQLASTERMLRQGQEEGVFIPQLTGNIPVTALAITRMIDVIKNSNVSGELQISSQRVMSGMMIVFLRGISTERGRGIIDRYILNDDNNFFNI